MEQGVGVGLWGSISEHYRTPAAVQRQQFEQHLEAGEEYSLPRNQRMEDGVDFGDQPTPTLNVPIPPDNKGFQLLQKMGWKNGTGLGKGENGLTAPVGTDVTDSGTKMGLGRMQLEHDQIAAETATRRQLTVEEQMNEDLQTTHNRLQRAEEREKTEAHVQEIKKSFFCEDCSKQYNSIAELEEHLSSYDHHHRKRLADLKKMEHERTREQRSKKESKRQAKEAARLEKQIAAARGMKNSTTAHAAPSATAAPPMPAALPPGPPPLPLHPAACEPPLPPPEQPPLPPEPPANKSYSRWDRQPAMPAGSYGAVNTPSQQHWNQQYVAPPLAPDPPAGSFSLPSFSLAPGQMHGYSSTNVEPRPPMPPDAASNATPGLSLSLGGQAQNVAQQSHQLAFAFGKKSKSAVVSRPKASLSMFSSTGDD